MRNFEKFLRRERCAKMRGERVGVARKRREERGEKEKKSVMSLVIEVGLIYGQK